MLAAIASPKGATPHQAAAEFFDQMPVKDVFSWTTLLSSYARNGWMEQAQEIFDSLDPKDVNAATRNVLMEGYAQKGDMQRAREIFENMQEKTVVSWNLMIADYGRVQQVEEARILFDRMLEKSQITWNAMLAAYAKKGHMQEAITLFNEMPVNDAVSWTCLLGAYCQAGDVRGAEGLLEEMPFERTLVHSTMLLSAHALAGDIDLARKLYDQMDSPDAVATNTMLAGYAWSGRIQDAIALFREAGSRADEDTPANNIMLLAYSSSGDFNLADQHFQEMRAPRDFQTWACLIRVHVHNSSSSRALELFHEGHSLTQESLLPVMIAYEKARPLAEAVSIGCHLKRKPHEDTLTNWHLLYSMLVKRRSFTRLQSPFPQQLHPVESRLQQLHSQQQTSPESVTATPSSPSHLLPGIVVADPVNAREA